jgi:hypothetical protein
MWQQALALSKRPFLGSKTGKNRQKVRFEAFSGMTYVHGHERK